MNGILPDPPVITPGSWLGVFGGGQLGRMFTHAAQRLGYHVAVLDPEANCPAAQVADLHIKPDNWANALESARELAKKCDVLTLEFENIPSDLVREASRSTRVCPRPDFLEMCQDRIAEKSKLTDAGFATTPFRKVSTEADLLAAGTEFGWPIVVKTARSGYDGKGQAICKSADEAAEIYCSLDTNHAIAEKWIQFEAEVSMITARNAAGQMVSYPLIENEHANHILNVSRCPASPHLKELEETAAQTCQGIADSFGVIGLFCVEFFVTNDNELLINEIAPRPHNSGHLTMEAFTCSQFEQQLRAICNLPLAEPQMNRPAAMVNLLGDIWGDNTEPNWPEAIRADDAYLHLYGKEQPRPGRKMGHLTVLDESSSEAAITAEELRDAISSSTVSN